VYVVADVQDFVAERTFVMTVDASHGCVSLLRVESGEETRCRRLRCCPLRMKTSLSRLGQPRSTRSQCTSPTRRCCNISPAVPARFLRERTPTLPVPRRSTARADHRAAEATFLLQRARGHQ
jgi:hypothetical protein